MTECPHCGQPASTAAGLKTHLRKAHGILTASDTPDNGPATVTIAFTDRETAVLEQIAKAVWFLCLSVGLVAVSGRLDISTAGNHQTVQAREEIPGIRRVDLLGRQDHGYATGPGHAF